LEPVLPLDSAEVFFDGIFSEPRLRHPQGIAIDESGDIWCGGETGEIYRISANGSGIETVASTGGFILGLAFDDDQNLYACDMRHSAVFRLDTRTGRLTHFANGGGRDAHSQLSRDRRLQELPVRLRQLRSRREGTGSLEIRPGERRRRALVRQGHDLRQRDGPLPTGITCTSRNRNPEEGELFVDELERVPDGLAFDAAGNLYIACYEPSRIYRVSPERDTSLYRRPRSAHPAPSNKLCVSRRTALHIQPGPVAHNADRSPLRGPSIALNGSLAWGIEPYRL
jgi:sugar lactone lactonase YvrE